MDLILYNYIMNPSNQINNKNKSKNTLISIYQHTINYCNKQKFPVYKSLKYDLDNEYFSNDIFLSDIIPFDNPAMILIENIDSFDMARKMNNTESLIMVLNLASNYTSGGGVSKGTKAQEEDLYRKSNYFEVNDQLLYPLQISEVIYSPLVYIVKDSAYRLLQTPYSVSCLAVAALRNPKLQYINGEYIYENQNDKKIMQNKIDMIFKTAINHNHVDIVLGAIGCGVFGNPSQEVARMFEKSLTKYKYYFKRIGFAILSGPNNTNFDTFNNIITLNKN